MASTSRSPSPATQGARYDSAQRQRKPLTLPRPTDPSYLYKAEVRDVIDAAGRRFVREQLAVARTVVINTRKHDIHRRYVAHVFYAFNKPGIESTFLNGRYLNQELIDKGFAKPV
ncbi:MAG: hypothetical protein WBM75_18085 [Polyangiales bacterium]|jgi:hypothetical protein